mmetsp:Transcript_42797/g.136989  ORF Transcript_42797/g.136989 Transcript_42797/m.136989 type:complete len:300 (+) Transcript_42797:262-1161(+)
MGALLRKRLCWRLPSGSLMATVDTPSPLAGSAASLAVLSLLRCAMASSAAAFLAAAASTSARALASSVAASSASLRARSRSAARCSSLVRSASRDAWYSASCSRRRRRLRSRSAWSARAATSMPPCSSSAVPSTERSCSASMAPSTAVMHDAREGGPVRSARYGYVLTRRKPLRVNASAERMSPPHTTKLSLTKFTSGPEQRTSRQNADVLWWSGECRYTRRNLNCCSAARRASRYPASTKAGRPPPSPYPATWNSSLKRTAAARGSSSAPPWSTSAVRNMTCWTLVGRMREPTAVTML